MLNLALNYANIKETCTSFVKSTKVTSIKHRSTSFDPTGNFNIVIDFNCSQKINGEYHTFSTSTSMRNASHLENPLRILHHAYLTFNGSNATYLGKNKLQGCIGGGRIDVRQGSLFLVVRFSISKDGEILEDDICERSVGQVLEKAGFTEFRNGNYYIREHFFQGRQT